MQWFMRYIVNDEQRSDHLDPSLAGDNELE